MSNNNGRWIIGDFIIAWECGSKFHRWKLAWLNVCMVIENSWIIVFWCRLKHMKLLKRLQCTVNFANDQNPANVKCNDSSIFFEIESKLISVSFHQTKCSIIEKPSHMRARYPQNSFRKVGWTVRIRGYHSQAIYQSREDWRNFFEVAI